MHTSPKILNSLNIWLNWIVSVCVCVCVIAVQLHMYQNDRTICAFIFSPFPHLCFSEWSPTFTERGLKLVSGCVGVVFFLCTGPVSLWVLHGFRWQKLRLLETMMQTAVVSFADWASVTAPSHHEPMYRNLRSCFVTVATLPLRALHFLFILGMNINECVVIGCVPDILCGQSWDVKRAKTIVLFWKIQFRSKSRSFKWTWCSPLRQQNLPKSNVDKVYYKYKDVLVLTL